MALPTKMIGQRTARVIPLRRPVVRAIRGFGSPDGLGEYASYPPVRPALPAVPMYDVNALLQGGQPVEPAAGLGDVFTSATHIGAGAVAGYIIGWMMSRKKDEETKAKYEVIGGVAGGLLGMAVIPKLVLAAVFLMNPPRQ